MWIDEQKKSFSSSDISNIDGHGKHLISHAEIVRHAVSEVDLNSIQNQCSRLSRSFSTYVSVGDPSSQSQLPSPNGQCVTSHIQQLSTSNLVNVLHPQQFTASELIKSISKKVYIRRRLLTTHRAIERLSQSEFNLDQLATMAEGAGTDTELVIPELIIPHVEDETNAKDQNTFSSISVPVDAKKMNRNLTIHDIEKSKGRPLSKYDRNILIFNWLHSLDESATD